MSTISDPIDGEVAAAGAARSDLGLKLPKDVRVTRGHGRSKVLLVRLNEEEYRLVEKLGEEQTTSASTSLVQCS